MKVCVWKTGHEIADTVAKAIDAEVRTIGEPLGDADVHIAYGILRGTADVFRKAPVWFHVDRGYTNPGHFDGNYRVSLRGTQQTGFWPEPVKHDVKLLPWRGFDHSKPVLVCPPTDAVRDFFSLQEWTHTNVKHYVVRKKGDQNPLNFNDYNYVLTFNSSVGWQAIAAGIPCVSDTTHSIIGTFFKNIPLANLSGAQYVERKRLFGTMSALQMTLEEMKQGKLWQLMSNLLSISATTVGNQPLVTSPRIP